MNYIIQPGVAAYDVLLRIETPVRLPDTKQFLPKNPHLLIKLKFFGVDEDTKGDEWHTYQWGATLTCEELLQLIDTEYGMDEQETEPNQWDTRIVQCLNFKGGASSAYLNEVTIYANPVLEGLPQEVLDRIAPLVIQ